MKKLKTKIFITIFTILTISILSILIIYNSTNYLQEKNNITNNLQRMSNDKKRDEKNDSKENKEREAPPEKQEGEEPKHFMDVNIYTVVIEDNQISNIISHTKEETTPSNIKKEAEKILKSNTKNKLVIGNLYIQKYSYNYQDTSQIIIIDNTETNQRLQTSLWMSLIIFITFELISYYICEKISKWIIQPVEESFNRQKQFIADASHELKTPLSVIMASAEAMESDDNPKWLENIKSESNRMSDLIKDLLDLAKLENEDNQKILEEQNLSKIVEMSILSLESIIYEKNLHLEYHIEDNIMLKCNNSEMKQLVTILMDNAIKHCQKKGNIFLSLTKEKENVILKVKNEGKPIPKGEEEKIFERFYRIDKSRNRGENRYGLGLAIAKKITETHNGTIKAQSKDGLTTFTVTLKK